MKLAILLLVLNTSLLPPIRTQSLNFDLLWYRDGSDEPQKYYARRTIPEEMVKAEKIVVKHDLPFLTEMKFGPFHELDELILEECGIREILPNSFRDMDLVTNLSVARNEIKVVKEGAFNFVKVKNLDLSHNKIRSVAPRAFDNMPFLHSVILDYNELRTWNPDWFFNCSSLRRVSMTHNFLEDLPEKAFKNFWTQPDARIDVYLGYNKITELHDRTFEDTRHFGDLRLNHNELSGGLEPLGHLAGVDNMDLASNFIECFPEAVPLTKFHKLSLEDNPLNCSCTEGLLRRRKDTQIVMDDMSDEC